MTILQRYIRFFPNCQNTISGTLTSLAVLYTLSYQPDMKVFVSSTFVKSLDLRPSFYSVISSSLTGDN